MRRNARFELVFQQKGRYPIVKKRILIAAPSAYTLGGVASWLDYLLPGLVTNGWTVVLALPHEGHHNADSYLSEHPFDNVVFMTSYSGTQESRVQCAMDIILDQDPDLVMSVNIPEVIIAAARLRQNGRFLGHTSVGLHGIKHNLIQDLEKLSPFLDGVITVNRLAGKLCTEVANIAENRVHYAAGGFERHGNGGIPTERRPDGYEGIRLCFVGRIETEDKRVLDLVKLVQELRKRALKFQIDIFGSGPSEDQLIYEMNAIGALATEVSISEAVSQSYLFNNVYCQTDGLVVTSSRETGPLVAWEAMSCGAVLISSRYIGSGFENSLINEVNCLLFNVGDMSGAADQVAKLKDEKLRNRIRIAGRNMVETHYTASKSIEQWDHAFRAILDGLPRSPDKTSDVTLHELAIKNGRLDKIFGPVLGENIRRRVLSSKSIHKETMTWPHTLSKSNDEAEFLRTAKRLDTPQRTAQEADTQI